MSDLRARAHTLLERLIDLGPADRDALLSAECAGQPELLTLVEAMLEADTAGHGMLDGDPLRLLTFLEDPVEAEAPDAAGSRLGPYRLVRLLGRGGMGAVYEAERDDGQFEQRVALKRLPPGTVTDATRRRFLAERRLLAGLQHPNIARLLDGGIAPDGSPYFAMEYVEGVRLDEYCRREAPGIEDRLQLFLQILDAIAYTHRHSIVHRDIKPANVLVTGDGQIKLVDFGIAKLLEADLDALTRTGERPLTPRYASPEQLAGGPVTPASDVYALGVVLFELLAGRAPRAIETAPGAGSAGTVDPAPPSRSAEDTATRRRLRGDLDAIVLKAMRREPAARYASAEAFAEDLRRHLQRLPVRARRGVLWYRTARFGRRHRAALAALALVSVAALLPTRWSADGPVPVLALGAIEDRTGGDTLGLAVALPGLLADGLAAVPELQLVTAERMHEVRAQLAASPEARLDHAVARMAGAEQLLEGVLSRDAAGLRLELRRTEVSTGRVQASYAVHGRESFALAGLAIARVVRDLGVRGEAARSEPPHRSLLARRLYAEGLRLYYGGDAAAASVVFESALREDSTLAMAAFYLWRARISAGQPYPGDTALARSVRLAANAPERERLLIYASWSNGLQNRDRLRWAELLAERYPLEPEGHRLTGLAKLSRGDFLGAIPHFRRVVALDSLTLRGADSHCVACDALRSMSDAYMRADSVEAALRVTREWIRHRPQSPAPRFHLAIILVYDERFAEALVERRAAAALSDRGNVNLEFPAWLALHAGRFDEADRLFEQIIDEGTRDDRLRGMWWLALSLREQGRLRDALRTARARRTLLTGAGAAVPPYSATLEGAILLDLGRAREAAALFDSLTVPHGNGWQGFAARPRAWLLTQKATALAQAGDTAALAPLAGAIRSIAGRTDYGLIWNLDGYVTGLLLAQRGDHQAAEPAFRRALYSLTGGYSRVNLELGRTLVMLGRAEQAAALLAAPLRGPIESGNTYLSRTRLRAELGRAWEAAGRPDSAAAHYRHVLNTWRNADPELLGARAEVARRLTRLEN